MKPLKLLACLVTLQFTCGLPLQAADPQDFRQWTDAKGRTMLARLVETPDKDSVKIERQDGRVFTVPVATFSAADQDYVKLHRAKNTTSATPADDSTYVAASAATWTLLNSGGNQPAALYDSTPLDQILDLINQRFTMKAVKTSGGLPLALRTEPADLAARIKISGDMPRMAMASFVQEIARLNDLSVKTDPTGMIVLVDKTAPKPETETDINFFGIRAKTP